MGLVLLLCLLLLPGARVQAGETTLSHVRLQLKWQHQFQFAGYYAAQARGYYREAGLEVEFLEGQPGMDTIEPVLRGQAQFGVGTSELMLLRAKGTQAVVLATLFQHSPLVLIARHNEHLSSLHDLKHLPVMIEPHSAEIFAYFKAEGIQPQQLKIVPRSFGVSDLVQGRVAAMTAYSTDEPYQLQQAGINFLTFTPRAGGIDFYGDNLFTTAQEIRLHPERVRAFRAASLRGWEYALGHREEMVDWILSHHGRVKSREQLLFEAERTMQLIHPELIPIGYTNPGRWRHIADTYAEFGMVPRSFDLGSFLYDSDPQPAHAWAYWAICGTLVIVLTFLLWALPLYQLNKSLRREIEERRNVESALRRAKESAETANGAKSHYLAVMAHEVRTPLCGIIGLMDLVAREPLAREQRENVDLAKSTATSLLKIISDTLDYSKLEAGSLEIETLPMSPKKFLREICDLFHASAQAKGTTLTYEIGPAVPALIKTDPTRLRQVLTNLLSNAIKFTEGGQVTVRLSAKADPAQPHRYQLFFQVQDTGEGMTGEELAGLFQPYSQANKTVSRRHGGTGLGLSISQRIAHLLGGIIRVESRKGEGSTFTVEVVVEEINLQGLSL